MVAAPAAPANTSPPTIAGSAQDGALLTASTGSWTHAPTSYGYQWQRCNASGGNCSPLAGANSQRYTVTSGDIGNRLRVKVTATNKTGTGTATSNPTAVVKKSGNAPAATALPTLGGSTQPGATLTATNGAWSGTQPLSFKYSWLRCNASGSSCGTVVGLASANTYKLTGADLGHTIRVEVTASNAVGSKSSTSTQTAVITAPTPAPAAHVLQISQVALPDRLVIDRVSFTPNPTRSRGAIVGRFHISDLHGTPVAGALVYVLGLPYGWTYNSPEQPTNSNGWATIIIRPTRNMPLRRGALVLFVRARKPGDNLLAGVSTRRLVQEGIR